MTFSPVVNFKMYNKANDVVGFYFDSFYLVIMPNITPPNERRKAIVEKRSSKSKADKFFKSPWWKILNSNIAIFVLSSVVVASITAGVSTYIQKQQIEFDKRKEASRYFIELQYRIFKLTTAVDAMTYAKRKILEAEKSGVVDTNRFIIISKYRHQLLDIINGTGTYRPLEPCFKDQHLTSIISWFGFNMGKPRDMYEEVKAVYGLEGSPPWGLPELNISENYKNMTTLTSFLINAQEYVLDFKFDRTKNVPLIKRPIFQ